ncbi:MAG TPA: bifunctional biotin--[acetyl-CoA-carboxylase] ligase/biotin operon repressor BirA [Arenimonas sp.]|uniref:bifunctional biotin--[acetyl-CoA-carboxylase] ligase/biotin operon repressor BirA n=1 Tax=Arenimonas sp. TaxID=1872635 RepID=UPI002D7F85FD|nr:bifunctional biotin--[acetyl-CoA-carboxylase] ligase/biotin operon repressor BirA [Arenimonas sp.]HEU0152461.1 bifunctional biotin--[acetyl-CoA-carboxylase] ligase/biotin operon repressor BirA [Arenimonas sp.]
MTDRALLARLCDGPASGAALARELGITRSAVWKRIEALRAAGVAIAARPGQGYALAQPLRLLDAGRLAAALSPAAQGELAGLEVLFDTDSTNAVALREPVPARGCGVWLAERQSAGRGRRGRAWTSPLAAHVYLSVSRRFDGGIAALQGLSLAVGVAAAEALQALGYRGIGLKWPNDLLAEGGKLGGILIEVGGDAAGPLRVVVGLGLNVAMPADAARDIDQPWCDLARLSATPPDREAVCVALLDALLPMLARFERDGLAPSLEAWARHDLLAGRAVRITEGERVYEGIAAGIDADGALRLRGPDGERRCHAGEASLRAA